jgi:hypothetical protein
MTTTPVSTLDASDVVKEAIEDLKDEAATIIPAALVVGATVLAVTRGWAYVRRFSK